MDDNIELLITGASSDIGSAVVDKVGSNPSNRLLVTTRNTSQEASFKKLPAVVKHLNAIDLTELEDVNKLALEAKKFFCNSFCWLHCAGDFWHHKSIEATDLDEAKQMISSHFITLYASAKAIVPVMKKVGGGRIIAFSCNSVRYNYPDMTAFTPSKAAVESFIRCLSNEVLESDILANCLALPTIATDKVLTTKSSKYHSYYIEVDDLVNMILDSFITMSPLVTGNAISLVKYSPYFYKEGYYQRNRTAEY